MEYSGIKWNKVKKMVKKIGNERLELKRTTPWREFFNKEDFDLNSEDEINKFYDKIKAVQWFEINLEKRPNHNAKEHIKEQIFSIDPVANGVTITCTCAHWSCVKRRGLLEILLDANLRSRASKGENKLTEKTLTDEQRSTVDSVLEKLKQHKAQFEATEKAKEQEEKSVELSEEPIMFEKIVQPEPIVKKEQITKPEPIVKKEIVQPEPIVKKEQITKLEPITQDFESKYYSEIQRREEAKQKLINQEHALIEEKRFQEKLLVSDIQNKERERRIKHLKEKLKKRKKEIKKKRVDSDSDSESEVNKEKDDSSDSSGFGYSSILLASSAAAFGLLLYSKVQTRVQQIKTSTPNVQQPIYQENPFGQSSSF